MQTTKVHSPTPAYHCQRIQSPTTSNASSHNDRVGIGFSTLVWPSFFIITIVTPLFGRPTKKHPLGINQPPLTYLNFRRPCTKSTNIRACHTHCFQESWERDVHLHPPSPPPPSPSPFPNQPNEIVNAIRPKTT
ncbi:hypothetical protein GALMADRAFT_566218 [Galerina marginata CBS 339.88]|uniref:Transmembrane protein n=1 Tax=Galerina marginata (strain CBS 339.88) TaxID=685588 RepID=A0A067SVH0_GALM3|nr:hypothetical protein GALMADRAFT_566218 [Galerina marginata CBS 339.88]